MTFGWRDYRNSLKDTEVEELIDLYFYRFLGYGFVKAISWSNMTPNQVTYLGMIFGLLSAAFFCQVGTDRRCGHAVAGKHHGLRRWSVGASEKKRHLSRRHC